jgi:hypothetical protein
MGCRHLQEHPEMTLVSSSSPISASTGTAMGDHPSRALGRSFWASYAFGCPDDSLLSEGLLRLMPKLRPSYRYAKPAGLTAMLRAGIEELLGGVEVDVGIPEPLGRLYGLSYLRQVLGEAETAYVRAAREAGASWETIGEALGVTKAAAWERFGA